MGFLLNGILALRRDLHKSLLNVDFLAVQLVIVNLLEPYHSKF